MSRKGPSSYTLLLWILILSSATSLLYASTTFSNLDWWVIGSGGRSQSGNNVLQGTLSQPVAGLTASGNNSLCAGFWCGTEREFVVYLPLVAKLFATSFSGLEVEPDNSTFRSSV